MLISAGLLLVLLCGCSTSLVAATCSDDDRGGCFDAGDTTAVYWSHPRYYLKASEFKFEIPGEGTVTMRNGRSVIFDGDWDPQTYMSIEVTWTGLSLMTQGGKEKRFFGYLNANGTNWWMGEARVYNTDEQWIRFNDPNTPLMSGKLNECFQRNELVLSSTDPPGSKITFKNVALAAFLPWQGYGVCVCSS
jgi:hypothetical protein